ncbi:MAG: hypothetical protein PHC88_12025 [Terrimicrobiaceae bacterium]|nr:hypothetical protein [Terrimicrobiaceae bacterium]
MTDPFDETDAALARKLAEITPPADLRARLLATRAQPGVREQPAAWWARGVTALAAALVLAFAVLSLWPRSVPSISAATADLSTFLSSDFALAMQTSDVGQVRSWLAQRNPDRRIDLPAALAGHRPLGCRELTWRGRRGSLACFSLADGRLAHLAMFPKAAFADAPGGTPKIAQAGKWTRAAWSKDGMTYLLFVPAGVDPMKELIGGVLARRTKEIASGQSWRNARIGIELRV